MNQITTKGLDSVKIADIVVTASLVIVGLYLVHSYWRQQAMRVAEKPLAAWVPNNLKVRKCYE